jgi:hypothetical protein
MQRLRQGAQTLKSEAEILREVQIAISNAGHRVFRNNIGVARDERGNYIRYGVCNPGGSDLIGWTVDGRFLAVEVKSEKGRLTKPQLRFLDAVISAGGVGVWGASVETIINGINDQLK